MVCTLDIIIVNWNTGTALRACIDSIVASRLNGFVLERVVVVDNGSRDGSCENLPADDLPLRLIGNDSNRGFAAACNQGAAGSTARYLLFLNPDTRLQPDTLSRVVAFMETEAGRTTGIAGVRLVDDQGATTTCCARFPTVRTFFSLATGLNRLWPRRWPTHLMSAEECAVTREVDQVIGAFFLVRRSLFEALDGFDERFFVYFEEVDFSLRARRLGYHSTLLAEVSAYHEGGVSSGQVRASRLFYSLRSRFLYAFKHYAATEALLLVLVTIGLELPGRLGFALVRRSPRDFAATVEAYAMLAGDAGWRTCRRVVGGLQAFR